MRKFFAGAAALVFGLAGASATVFVPVGPATMEFDAMTQATPFHLVSSNGSMTATTTNVMLIESETVSTTPFATSNLLALLANSLNTNFPAGARIGFGLGTLVVLDQTGTNVIFNPSSVLTINGNEQVASDKQTRITTQNQNGISLSGNNSETLTTDVTINYDDTNVSPTDGINSTFKVRGVLEEKFSTNLKTGFSKINFQFQGSGGGSVHGVTTVLSGTIKEKAAGAPSGF